jgi:hypothetical protein
MSDALRVDVAHDAAQPRIDFCARPREAQAVLAHLETRGRDATGSASPR